MTDLIRQIRDHALAHYGDGGWDVIVEAWDDDAIADAIGKARTLDGALRKLRPIVGVYADRQADARIEGAYDPPPPPEPEPGCGWMVEHRGQWVEYEVEPGEWYGEWTEPGVRECGAKVTETDRGWTCDAGHGHVFMEVRHAEGWDYAEDDGDAMNLTKAGTEPRDLVTGGAYRW